MHAGFSFSYSPISVLLRQPLSIKKSYAGAIQYKCSINQYRDHKACNYFLGINMDEKYLN
jgi:hypothetical protein